MSDSLHGHLLFDVSDLSGLIAEAGLDIGPSITHERQVAIAAKAVALVSSSITCPEVDFEREFSSCMDELEAELPLRAEENEFFSGLVRHITRTALVAINAQCDSFGYKDDVVSQIPGRFELANSWNS